MPKKQKMCMYNKDGNRYANELYPSIKIQKVRVNK